MEQPDAPPALPAPRRAAVAFIFVTLLLDVLAFGILIPVLPPLIKEFVGGDTAKAAAYYGLFGTVWAFMQFLCSPILGSLSDHFGRRSVILVSCFGLGLDYIIMALAPSLWWLLVGRIISGITASGFATANAYIADVTPPEKRAATYGIMGAAFGLGFVLGPAVGGILGESNPRLPFWIAAGLTLLNATYGLFVLPESLPKDRRTGFSWARANPVGSLMLLKSHSHLLGLAAVHFLYWLAHQVLPSVFVLYAGFRYQWSERTVGLTMALVGVCNIIVQAALVRPAVKRFGERHMLVTGLVFGAIGYALYALAPSGKLFLAAVPVFAFMGFVSPSLLGLMTTRVSPQEQGRLQGANASLMGITGMIGPALFTQVFAYAVHTERTTHVPGAPFFLASSLIALAVLVAWTVTRREPERVATTA